MSGLGYEDMDNTFYATGPSHPRYDKNDRKGLITLVEAITVGDSIEWKNRKTPAKVTKVEADKGLRRIRLKGNRGGKYKIVYYKDYQMGRNNSNVVLVRISKTSENGKMPLKRIRLINTSLLEEESKKYLNFDYEQPVVDGLKEAVKYLGNMTPENNSLDRDDWKELKDWNQLFASARMMHYALENWTHYRNGQEYIEVNEKMFEILQAAGDQAVDKSMDNWKDGINKPLNKEQVINLIEGDYYSLRRTSDENLIQEVKDM